MPFGFCFFFFLSFFYQFISWPPFSLTFLQRNPSSRVFKPSLHTKNSARPVAFKRVESLLGTCLSVIELSPSGSDS
jgi:hypothetical protein